MPRQQKYILYVSFPLPETSEEMSKRTDEVERIVQGTFIGSGAGFGMRDVDFEFDTAEERRAAVKRLKASGRDDYQISMPSYSEVKDLRDDGDL